MSEDIGLTVISPETSLTLDLQTARSWIAKYGEEIEEILYDCLQAELKKRQEIMAKGLDVSERRPFDLSWDIHANPLCQVWLDPKTPAHLREHVKRFVVEIADKKGSPRRVSHVCFTFGEVILDPTFGQFVALDESIQRSPEMFVRRSLLAGRGKIEKVFGISYIEPVI